MPVSFGVYPQSSFPRLALTVLSPGSGYAYPEPGRGTATTSSRSEIFGSARLYK